MKLKTNEEKIQNFMENENSNLLLQKEFKNIKEQNYELRSKNLNLEQDLENWKQKSNIWKSKFEDHEESRTKLCHDMGLEVTKMSLEKFFFHSKFKGKKSTHFHKFSV